jgi:phosphotransferase system HPr-like phosphotransfer protein
MNYSETKNKNKMYITFHKKDEIISFVNVCNRFDDAIDIINDKSVVDAKSVMGMFTLELETPYEIKYECFDEEDNYEEFLAEVKDKYDITLT